MTPTLAEISKKAGEYALGYLSSVELGIPATVTDTDHDALMKKIVQAIAMAWSEGYYTRDNEKKGRR